MVNNQVRILLVGASVWYLGEGMLGPLFAVFSEKIGGSVLDITWAWATYLVVTGIMNIVVGVFSDGHGRKATIMVYGYILNAVFTFSYLLVQTPAHLFIVQAGLGVASALATPTWSALYAKYEDRKHDGYSWGLASGQASIITGIAIVIGGFLVTYVSFRALFVVMGCIQTIAAFVQSRILMKKKSR